MNPTTNGRFRIHDRRPRPSVDTADSTDGPTEGTGASETTGASQEFVLVERPDEPIDPTDPAAADAYEPIYVAADDYDGPELRERVADLAPGYVVDATLAWDDGTARFSELSVVREGRFRFADGVEGMFEAAVEAWQGLRAEGEAMGSVTTRSNDGDPNGALYLFADGPGSDTFGEIRGGRIPIEPLIDRVNAERGVEPREVFVLRPAAHEFVAVYVVFDPDGVLARTIRDTYDLGSGLASALDTGSGEIGPEPDLDTGSEQDSG